MKLFRKILITISCIVLVGVSAFRIQKEVPVQLPGNFPKPVYDIEKHPVSEEGFVLGRELFYDPMLSRDGSISCGSCHQQFAGFTNQDHTFSHGVESRLGRRNALPLMNLIFSGTYFWDGGVHNLDLTPLNALENEAEMDETIDHVLEKLNASVHYQKRFKAVYGVEKITSKEFLLSLTQFMAPMISANSRYDRFVRNEGEKLTSEESAGLQVFQQKCSSCHATDLFTDGSFRNNGVPNNFRFDKGREEITLNEADRGKYRVPTLRNLEFTAPYMHDGSIPTLEAVLEHYQSGVEDSETLDPLLKKGDKPGIALTDNEKKQLLAFLKTLSDPEFIKNPRFSEQ